MTLSHIRSSFNRRPKQFQLKRTKKYIYIHTSVEFFVDSDEKKKRTNKKHKQQYLKKRV